MLNTFQQKDNNKIMLTNHPAALGAGEVAGFLPRALPTRPYALVVAREVREAGLGTPKLPNFFLYSKK
jgi:hypothetical protein